MPNPLFLKDLAFIYLLFENNKMGKPTILIADACNETLQKRCESFLSDGYDVISSNNGVDVVKMTMSTQPAAIILGDDLPEMNGYHVCRLLRNDAATKSIPVIMLTSKNGAAQNHSGSDACPDEKMSKECDPKNLLKVVRQRLDENGKGNQLSAKTKRSIDHVDIITDLNYLLDKKGVEAEMFSRLPGLVQNIFSYDDLAVSIMDMFPQIADYSVAMIVVISDNESKLVIHLHNDINHKLFSKIKQIAVNKFKEEINIFDTSTMWVKTIGEDRIVNNKKADDAGIGKLVFSQFTNSGILKKGFLIFGKQDSTIDDNKQALLSTICNSACIILESSWLYNKLYKNVKNLTITDSLTNIYNHKYIIGLVNQEFSRAKRYNHNISIIMFDIDYFKKVNDTFGHQTGDVVLREIAAIIKDSIRKSDVVGRYGGEEFTILLPETDTEDAMLFAERLRKRVEDFDFFNPADPLKITASMGVATYPMNPADNATSFIRCADKALYAAKESGRNSVHICKDNK
ncbi:MAG: GGDEF domain-containing response regulator [Candidatus Anammoxibacter sp.]